MTFGESTSSVVGEEVLVEFLAELAADRVAGCAHPLRHYLTRFAGHEEIVAREFVRAERGSSSWGAPRPLPDRIGPYEIVRELGRGGQAVVYLAEDRAGHGPVALKVLTGRWLGGHSESVLRLRREARALSRLDHPGICEILRIEADAELPYIVMGYHEGEDLARRLARARTGAGPRPLMDVSAAVGLIEQVARALHAAHEHGLVHRDVKPGNVLVSPEGRPVILDFGLALDGEADASSLTRSGELFGTLPYMSPEQLDRGSADVDRRTDVYSLGVTLFELLTLRRPFRAPSRQALFQRILEAEPPDPRKYDPRVSSDLAAVLQAALEKDPARRYATAEALADDLGRVRSGQRVSVRPIGSARRTLRRLRREPVLCALLVLAIASAGLVGFFVSEWPKIRQADRKLENERRQARHEELLADGFLALGEGRARDALLTLQTAVRATPDSVEGVAGIALAHLNLGDPASAHRFLEDRPELRRRHPTLDLFRADALRALGAADLAAEIEERHAQERPRTAVGWFLLGQRSGHRAQRNVDIPGFKDALAHFTAAVRHPGNDRALYHFMRATTASMSRDREAALEAARILETRWRDSATAWFYVGIALSNFDQEASLRALARSLEMDPDRARTLTFQGVVLAEAGRFSEAVSVLLRSVALEPDVARHRGVLGVTLLRAKKPAQALPWLEAAVRLDPDIAPARYGLALAYRALGRHDDAVAAYREMVRREPRGLPAWLGLARTLLDSGDAEGALVAAMRVLELDPENVHARCLEGRCHQRCSRFDAAIGAYRRVLASDPEHAEAMCRLGHALLHAWEFEDAVHWLRRGHEQGSRRGNWKLDSARWLSDAESLARHAGPLRRSIESDPALRRGGDFASLARHALRLGDPTTAIRAFRRAIDDAPRTAEDPTCRLRFEAARAATRAAASPATSVRTRRRLLRQAVDWLDDELSAWERRLVRAPGDHPKLRAYVAEWNSSADLAALRDPESLEGTTAADADLCSDLWSRAADLARVVRR